MSRVAVALLVATTTLAAGRAAAGCRAAAGFQEYYVLGREAHIYDMFVDVDVNAGLTASTTQTQAGGLALTAQINEVSVVANDNDTVVLPTAVAGRSCTIINNDAAQDIRIFPASGDNLGAGVDTQRTATLLFGEMTTYIAYDATNWVEVGDPTQ